MSAITTLFTFGISFCLHSVLCLFDERSAYYCQRRDCHGLSESEGANQTIYFGLMLSYSDPQGRESLAAAFDDGHDIAPAAYLAVEQINNRSDLVSDYIVEFIRVDGGCTVTERTAIGINELFCSCKPIVGIVGPSCGTSAEMVGKVTGSEQLSMVSIHYGERKRLGNRLDYPYAFGILGSSSTYAEAFMELIKSNNWIKMALLYSEEDIDLLTVVQDIQKIVGVTDRFKIAFSSAVSNTYIPIQDVKHSFIRIIISFMSPETTLRTLCLAYHEGIMFPKYQWVFKERVQTDFHETTFLYDGKMYSCSDTDIRSSISGSINLVFNAISEPLNNIDGTSNDINVTYKEYTTQYDLQRRDYIRKFNVNSTETLWARGIYDAVWSLAFALNSSLKELYNTSLRETKPGNAVVARAIRNHLHNLDFRGLSGRIKFDNETGFNIDSTVNVYQYREENVETNIGFYANKSLTLLSEANPMFVNASFAEEHVEIKTYVLVLIFVLTVVSFLITLSIHLVSTIYRNHRAIKASSNRLNHFIFLGCYLVLIGTSLLILSYSVKSNLRSSVCIAIPWIVTPGTTLIIGTVCLKSWRLYRIYSVSKIAYDPNAQLFISDSLLSVALVVMVVIDFVICLSWTISDRLEVNERREIFQEGDSLPVIRIHLNCQSTYLIYWMLTIVAYKGILTLLSLLLGVRTRINMKEFKTKNVIVLGYALGVIVGLGIPITTVVTIINLGNTIQFVVLSMTINIVVYACVLTLFYPMMIPLIKERPLT